MSKLPIYDVIGNEHARQRRADSRIAAAIHVALSESTSVLNVGAGAGSYEPADRDVVALDPSSIMLAQHPRGAAPCVRARAEALPFANGSFDAVLGVLTLHHWTEPIGGLGECARVARARIVLLTYDPSAGGYWLTRDYFPEITTVDRDTFPRLDEIALAFGPDVRVDCLPVPIPNDCVDGFLGAFWARPSAYLDERVRAGMSAFARCAAEAGLARLRNDLADGTWSVRYGHLLCHATLDLGYRLIVAHLPNRRG